MATISDLQKGLVGHWTMNSEDVDSGTVRDRSPYDNHGTFNGGVSNGGYAPSGSALEFDGNDDNVDLGDPSLFNEITDEFSVSVWFKTSSTGDQVILNNANYNDDTGWQIRTDSGDRIQLEYYDTSNGNTQPDSNAGNLTNGQWHHFVVTFDANNEFVYYVDGKYDLNGSSNEILDNDNINTRIGAMEISGHDRRFNGKISDVRVYNRALSQSEITQLYNQRTARAHKMQRVPVAQQDLVAHYPFASPGATDQSGNGNDGTNNGAIYIDDGGVNTNGAYDFDPNNNEKISFSADASDLNIEGQKPKTISFWVYTRNNDGGIFDIGTSNRGEELSLRGRGGTSYRAQFWSSADIDFSYDSINKWVHFVITWDGSETRIYANDSLQANANNNLNTVDGRPLTIGEWKGDYFDGEIGDFRIYDRAFSKYEVKRLYQSEGAVFGGIEKGYKSSDLTFFANQWNGSSNNGEVDITGSQFTKRSGEIIDITPINNGVALQDGDSSSEGYIMYSEEPVRDRFSDNPPHPSNGDYLVGVRKNGETWEYDDNTSFHEFSPRPTDHLIAEVGWGVDFVNGLNIYS